MKITQGRIEYLGMLADNVLANRAYRYPVMEGRALFLFRKAAAVVRQFQQEERAKLISQYDPEILENGLAKFKTEEDCAAFLQAKTELESIEEEMEMCPFRLRTPKGLELSQADLEAMDGVIEMYEEDAEPEIRVEAAGMVPENAK